MGASRSEKNGGAELELSIVKRVAETHGAAIDARSRVGRGTTLIIKIPRIG
jgi:signal transduction histidine kinase